MKILVPVDGSAASIRAVEFAINQVKPVAGASLVIVNVQNSATLGLAEGAGIMPLAWIEQEEESAATEVLQEAVTACLDSGVAYVTRAGKCRRSCAASGACISPVSGGYLHGAGRDAVGRSRWTPTRLVRQKLVGTGNMWRPLFASGDPYRWQL